MTEYTGCGSHSCYLSKPSGQGTNGPCKCLQNLPKKIREAVKLRLLEGDRIRKKLEKDVDVFQNIVNNQNQKAANDQWNAGMEALEDRRTM